jgi:hypothetical protein
MFPVGGRRETARDIRRESDNGDIKHYEKILFTAYESVPASCLHERKKAELKHAEQAHRDIRLMIHTRFPPFRRGFTGGDILTGIVYHRIGANKNVFERMHCRLVIFFSFPAVPDINTGASSYFQKLPVRNVNVKRQYMYILILWQWFVNIYSQHLLRLSSGDFLFLRAVLFLRRPAVTMVCTAIYLQ